MRTDNIMDMQYIIECIINQRKLVKEIMNEENTPLTKKIKDNLSIRFKAKQYELLQEFSDYVIKATAFFVQEGKIDEANKLFKDYIDNIDKVNELIDTDINL
jgi:hypothetical protein